MHKLRDSFRLIDETSFNFQAPGRTNGSGMSHTHVRPGQGGPIDGPPIVTGDSGGRDERGESQSFGGKWAGKKVGRMEKISLEIGWGREMGGGHLSWACRTKCPISLQQRNAI